MQRCAATWFNVKTKAYIFVFGSVFSETTWRQEVKHESKMVSHQIFFCRFWKASSKESQRNTQTAI